MIYTTSGKGEKAKFHFEFESFEDMLDYVTTEPMAENWAESPSSKKPVERNYHGAGNTWDRTIELARNGWPEGCESFASKMMDVASRSTGVGRASEFYNDVAGFRPDIPAYIAGEPDCMIALNEGAVITNRVVRIAMNLSVSAGVDQELIVNWGSALCVLIDALEDAGQSVELSGIIETDGHGQGRLILETIFKDAGEPLDVDGMAFMLAHPCYLRRLVFRAYETKPELYKGWHMGYGSPRSITRNGREDMILIAGVNDNTDDARDIDTAVRRVKELFEQ